MTTPATTEGCEQNKQCHCDLSESHWDLSDRRGGGYEPTTLVLRHVEISIYLKKTSSWWCGYINRNRTCTTSRRFLWLVYVSTCALYEFNMYMHSIAHIPTLHRSSLRCAKYVNMTMFFKVSLKIEFRLRCIPGRMRAGRRVILGIWNRKTVQKSKF